MSPASLGNTATLNRMLISEEADKLITNYCRENRVMSRAEGIRQIINRGLNDWIKEVQEVAQT